MTAYEMLSGANGAAELMPPLQAWTRGRDCGDCAPLDQAAANPVLPAALEPAVYRLDDAMLQGPYRLIQAFVCQSCGCCWQFDADKSAWARLI